MLTTVMFSIAPDTSSLSYATASPAGGDTR
jgi:hypothetical protein